MLPKIQNNGTSESQHKIRIKLTLLNLLFVLLLAGAAIAIGYFANRHPLQHDMTFNTINSLEPGSISVLQELDGPINVTAYATLQDPRLGDIRKIIRDILSLYQRYKPDLHLQFINPEDEPEKTREARVQLNGEIIIEYAGRSEHLTKINEQTITSALLRLGHTRDQTVMYLTGHGERKLDGIANHDMGTLFGAKLTQNGFKINSLNLAIAQDVPDNTNLLLITQPQVELMSGEVDKLLHYVERGGNLLWLMDTGPLYGLERLAEKLDLILAPGMVIDPAATGLNAPATWSLGASYPPHAITGNFNMITAFPGARPLAWNEGSDWKQQVLVEVASRGWISRDTTRIDSKVQDFNKLRDTPGPAIIALALSRNINDLDQRIVVVGNGAFLANSFAGNGGNIDLGINMVNWLSGDEKMITLQPRAAKDSNLTLERTHLTAIGISFLIILPLLLAGVGGYMWWKRRRA